MLRRILSLLGVILGVLGIAISVVILIVMWSSKSNIESAALSVYPPVENVLNIMSNTADQTDNVVTLAQQNLDNPDEFTLIEQIDDLQLQIDGAQQLVQSINDLGGRDNNQEIINSFIKSSDADDVDLQYLEEGLGILSDELDRARTAIESDNTSPTTLEDRLGEIHEVVKRVQTDVETFQGRVDTLKEQTPRTINIIVWIITIVLIWGAVGQWFLLRSSLRWFQGNVA